MAARTPPVTLPTEIVDGDPGHEQHHEDVHAFFNGMIVAGGSRMATAADIAAGGGVLDADLTAIAALDSATAGAIASDGAGWIKKTYAQFRTALGLGGAALLNVGTTAGTVAAGDDSRFGGGGGSGGTTGVLDVSAPLSGSGLTALIANDITKAAANLTALQAIVDYCVANKFTLYLPPGDWYLAYPATAMPNSGVGINVTGDLTVVGAGRKATRLVYPTTFTGYKITCWAHAVHINVHMRDFTAVGPTVWPTPFMSFASAEDINLIEFIRWNPGNGSLYLQRHDLTGYWTVNTFSNNGAAAGNGKLVIDDCDHSSVDMNHAYFANFASSGYEGYFRNNSVFRSHPFTDVSAFTFAASAVSVSGTTVTVTTSTAHGLLFSVSISEFVFLKGFTSNGMTGLTDGIYTVTSTPTSTTFTVTKSGVTGTYSGSGASVIQDWWDHGLGFYTSEHVSLDGDNCQFIGGNRVSVKQFGSAPTAFAVTAASISAPNLTLTTSASHGYSVGNDVYVAGLTTNGMTGLSERPRYTITAVPSATTLTLTVVGAAGTYDGSGATVQLAGPRFTRMRNITFRGGRTPFETTDLLGGVTEFVNCANYSQGKSGQVAMDPTSARSGGFVIRTDTTLTDTKFLAEGQQLVGQYSDARSIRVRVVNPTILYQQASVGGQCIGMAAGAGAARSFLEILGGHAYIDAPTGQFISNDATAPWDTLIDGLIIEGGPNRAASSTRLIVLANGTCRVRNAEFIGTLGAIFGGSDSNFEELTIDYCDFRQTVGGIFQAPNNAALDNKVRGQANKFAAGNEPSWSNAGTFQQFEPRAGFFPTPLTTVNNLAPGVHHTGFHLAVGSATNVNNVWVGGSADTNRARTGMIMFVADDGNSTFKHNAGGTGNLRTTSGADVALTTGQSIRFIKDGVNNIWLQA